MNRVRSVIKWTLKTILWILVVFVLLFIIVASIILAQVKIGPVDLSLAVSIVPFFIQFFNFFVGTIQAFLFTWLVKG